MEKRIDELLAKIERNEIELKENGNRTAITQEHINFLKNEFSDIMSIYRRAEKEIDFIFDEINEVERGLL